MPKIEKAEKWFVSRQRNWPDGDLVVEIAAGGLDYSNPGMLVSKYSGEGQEYTDPREAVEAAIKIATAWRKDAPKEEIGIAHGSTGGWTMPFEGEPLTDETFKELREWADAAWESQPKCDVCGGLREETYTLTEDPEAGHFCSENCADKQQRFLAEENVKFTVGELDEDALRAILLSNGWELDDTDTEESMRELIIKEVLNGSIDEDHIHNPPEIEEPEPDVDELTENQDFERSDEYYGDYGGSD